MTKMKRYASLVIGWGFLSVMFTNCSGSLTSQSESSSSSPSNPANGALTSFACGPEDRYFPLNAVTVTIAQKANLQATLDAQKIVRLEAGNYNIPVTVRSGQQLYGVPGRTILTTVTVEPGTTGSIVRGINLTRLDFPASLASTHDNCFSMLEGDVRSIGGTVENNVFLSLFHSEIFMDNRAGGLTKNNKFIRVQSHGAGTYTDRAATSLLGDASLKSTGNTFTFVNHLGPFKTPILLENQNEVNLLGVDVEDYNTEPGTEAVITAKNLKKLKIMDLQGGINQGMLDAGAEELTLVGNAFYRTGNPPIVLRSNNKKALWVSNMNNLTNIITDENPSGLRVAIETTDLKRFEVNKTAPANLTGTNATDTLSLLAPTANTVPWPKVSSRPIADPGGPNWNVNLASKPDDAPAIQAILNANPNANIQLEPRTYYIGTSIRLTGNATITGAGPDKTLLIAKNDTIKIFEVESIAFTFMDFTLQGGDVGLNFGKPAIQSTAFYMSHITIRNMKTAGIFLNQTYAWDNGFLEYVDFYKNAVGFKVYGYNANLNSESDTNAYIDKVFFHRNQYVANQKGLEFDPRRQSNMNFWFESSFRDNTVLAMDVSGWNTTYFYVSSVFSNNAGDPSIRGGVNAYYVNSSFTMGPALSLFEPTTLCEGCDISRGTSTTGTVYKLSPAYDPRTYMMSWLMNSNLNDTPIGALTTSPSRWSMLMMNNQMAPVDAQYSVPMSMFIYETFETPYLGDDIRHAPVFWLSGQVSPGTRFLRQPANQ